MIVQIDNTNAKIALSGHVLKNDCPDRVDYGAKSVGNIDKNDAVIESGHRAKSVDKCDVNGISGHVSGHNDTVINCNGTHCGTFCPSKVDNFNVNSVKGHFKGQSASYNESKNLNMTITDFLSDMSDKKQK